MGEKFIGKDNISLVLGDNYFYAQSLTKKLIEQIKPFKTNFHLNERVEQISKEKDEWKIKTNNNKFFFHRSPELIYGLRNFIGNAVKFSKSTVEIKVISNSSNPCFDSHLLIGPELFSTSIASNSFVMVFLKI